MAVRSYSDGAEGRLTVVEARIRMRRVTWRLRGKLERCNPADPALRPLSGWVRGATVGAAFAGILMCEILRRLRRQPIEIGVAAFRSPEDVTLPAVLAMPFVDQPVTQQLPDGRGPDRIAISAPATRLQP